MSSFQSKITYHLLKLLGIRRMFDQAFATGMFRKDEVKEPPRQCYSLLEIEKQSIEGHSVFTLKPKKDGTGKRILYLHGGGYVFGFSRMHWTFMSQLVLSTKATVIAPDYPLAPEWTFEKVYDWLLPLYKELLDSAGGDNVILMGDSAGAGIALGLAQRLKESQQETAGQIVLLSPWLDLTLSNPEIPAVEAYDVVLSRSGLAKASAAYAGQADPSHYLLSPINGSMAGLGNISLFIGTRDLFEPDARRFRDLLAQQQIPIQYFTYPDMVHVWMLFNLPESKSVVQKIGQLLGRD